MNKMARSDRFPSGLSKLKADHGSAAADPEASPPLYPPLNIPDPYISEKKRTVAGSILKYKHLIDSTRSRYAGEDFKPSGLFQPPDFGPPRSKLSKPKTKVKVTKESSPDKAAEDAEKDADTEDEDKPATAVKAKDDDDEDGDAEAKPSDEDEDDENAAAKSDSDIDDYTANTGFDDDEMNFEEDGGGDADNDAHTF